MAATSVLVALVLALSSAVGAQATEEQVPPEGFEVTIAEIQVAASTPVDGPRDLSADSFVYGDREFPVPPQVIARAALGLSPWEDAGGWLSEPVEVLDVNDRVAYYGLNFELADGRRGVVVVGAHTRAELVLLIEYDRELDLALPAYYFEPLGVVQVDDVDSDGRGIVSRASLDAHRAAERARLLTLDREQINYREVENKVALNNLSNLRAVKGQKSRGSWSGQDVDGDYGGIYDVAKYLSDRYGGTWGRRSSKALAAPAFTMRRIASDAGLAGDRNNCVPTGVARMISMQRNIGFTKISSNSASVYITARSVSKRHGWTVTGGVMPDNIDDIAKGTAVAYGYANSRADNFYIWAYEGTIQGQVSMGRPILWNIGRGYYGAHTVTVTGWAEWRSGLRTARMVQVHDGWKEGVRWVDYDAFMRAPVSSFTTLRTAG